MNARYCVTMLQRRVREVLESGLTGRPHPAYPGAVALVLREGEVVAHEAVGHALRYADATGSELATDAQVPMSPDTLFDVASLTKLFTTTVLMALSDEDALTLDSPIHPWLPTFSVGVRRSVSARHLLSHMSGLPAWLELWTGWPDQASRRESVLGTPLERGAGAAFTYSDLGFMTAGWLAEAVAGTPLSTLVRDRVCLPLGMSDAGFLPREELRARIAATEDEASCGRGMLRGSVHDENSWSLGGAAGHAGVFATAMDVARLGEMIRRGGELDGVRVLREAAVTEMCTDQLPAHLDPGFRQGLGVRLGDPGFMGGLTGPRTVGHTGFTGTSLVIDLDRQLTIVLLTNRVHPSRTWSDVGHVRRALADAVLGSLRSTRRGRGPRMAQRDQDAPGLLVRIRAEMPTLRPAELRVALGILEDPAGAARLAIGTLAERCETSPATVLRFCRAVGFTSYPALRLELARETGRARDGDGPPSPTGDITPTDTVPQIVAKIAWSDARAIEDTAALLDVVSLAAAIDAVAGARRIDIYGVGASGFVAQDLHQKLHRIGLLSSVSPDPHAALTSAALLGPGDVAIAISHTGTTTDTVEALRVAEASGATTIAITNVRDAPLTGHARLVLTTASRETTFRSGAMASRIAQLAVVDCLFVGVAQRSWDRTLRALERTFVAVQGRRIPAGRRRARSAR